MIPIGVLKERSTTGPQCRAVAEWTTNLIASTYEFDLAVFPDEISSRMMILAIAPTFSVDARKIIKVDLLSTAGALIGTFTKLIESSSTQGVSIWGKSVPTGTAYKFKVYIGDAFSQPKNATRMAVEAYRVSGTVGGLSLLDTAVSNNHVTGTPANLNMDVVPGSVSIAMAASVNPTFSNASWVGMIEDGDTDVSGSGSFSVAHWISPLTETPRTMNVSSGVTTQCCAITLQP
jgi:hypothetical protein